MAIWECTPETLHGGRVRRYVPRRDGAGVAFRDVVRMWQAQDGEGAEFRAFFASLLAEAPFRAFRWETPAVSSATASRAFEFALLDCAALEREADAESFAEQFDCGGAGGEQTVT